MPLVKKRCKKGYNSRIGAVDTTINAYLMISAINAAVLSSAAAALNSALWFKEGYSAKQAVMDILEGIV
jgi:hypothetical protein